MDTEMEYSAKSDDVLGRTSLGNTERSKRRRASGTSHGIRWVSRDRKKEQGCRKGCFQEPGLSGVAASR